MDGIALDTINYDIDSVYTRQINRQWLFNQVATYDTLRTDDTNMNNFYNNNLSNNIGVMYAINNNLAEGYNTEANGLLSTFTPADTIEANYKTVDSIYTHTLSVGVDTLDSLDFVHLYNIAYQCPYMGGMAVYQARSMLNVLTDLEWEFSDSCNTSSGRVGHRAVKPPQTTTQAIPDLSAKVYPNPANSTLNVEVRLPSGKAYQICIYSSLGEKVICEQLEQNITSLPTNTLVPGIYYYRISDMNGLLIKSDKVMIIH